MRRNSFADGEVHASPLYFVIKRFAAVLSTRCRRQPRNSNSQLLFNTAMKNDILCAERKRSFPEERIVDMKQNTEFKPKAGYVYVVTNECLKLVKAKSIFRGKMVKAVKIGNAKDFTNRLGSLNTAVYENFDFHLGIRTDDVVGLEGLIHTALKDYRIYTRDKRPTEFFACPLDEVISRIRTLIGRGHKLDVEEYKGERPEGRSGANIRANMKRRETVKAKVVKSAHKNMGKAKAFSFTEVGIPNGARLVFVPTGAEVTVIGDKKIEYKGTQYSLSGFCKVFMPQKNDSGAYQGPKFFSYNGRTLLDIRKKRERN